ncbi:MAG TPA: aminomethyl-transferring glycine dehydrogenase subunit GcvPA [Planctomycetaceae bacterium]|nr:aminomethyl-transferring glycine dehydrogenase subunit GcvPA [Planctomycetaceae bacterium]
MTYLFNTPDQRREMLQAVGAQSIDELFDQVPADCRLSRALELPSPLTEMELEREVSVLAGRNVAGGKRVCLMGGGVYDHFIPAAVDEVVSRGEFYTAYTPYQAEASQGSLQAFFEYQSLVCRLTGMDISNASMYEGGTSVSEAAFMAMRVTGRHDKVVVLGSVNPEYREVLRSYLSNLKCELVVLPTPEGTAQLADVKKALDDKTACLVFQHPNFFGCLEEPEELARLARSVGALSIVAFDPISLGLLRRPGDYGADVAVAEGQSLGIPMQYGGPFLGIFTCREKFVRKMPGRLVGRTTDRIGRPCYVLTLQAREQHIRREKATSNICTNQGLLALRATAYLSLVGPQGLKEAAELCCRKAHYAAERLTSIPGVKLAFDRPFFKEFTLRCTGGAEAILLKARQAGFDLGPSLSRFGTAIGDSLKDAVLVAVTEKRTKREIDDLAAALGG